MKCCNSDQKIKPSIDEQSLDELICYCFKHSKKELKEAIDSGKEGEFITNIKAKIIDPGCFCETANPSGKCCLPDISNFIRSVKNAGTAQFK